MTFQAEMKKTVKEKRPPRAVGKATDPKMRLVMGRGSRNAPLCAGVRTDLAIEYPESEYFIVLVLTEGSGAVLASKQAS